MDEPTLSTGEVSQAPANPLAPSALRQLFLSPSAYFRSASLDAGPAWLFVVWISGLSSVIDRVDQKLLQADMNGSHSSLGVIAESWVNYWGLVLSTGILWAFWNWWIGGWWYRLRLSWSGAANTDPRQARLVYLFAGFVMNLPTVLYALAQTIAYPNYLAAWEAEFGWGLLILAFLFWSTVVSWRGVLAVFPVRPARALWWFLILPIAFYCVLFGTIGALLAEAEGA